MENVYNVFMVKKWINKTNGLIFIIIDTYII